MADTILVFDSLDTVAPPSHDSAVIDQADKKFVPKISVIRSGTSVTFPNSDQIRHQVYSFSPAKTFTIKLYAGSPMMAESFDKAGLVVLGCNIHDTMSAFVAVVETPYFSKTSVSGEASLNLPAGRYRVRAWHPRLESAVTLEAFKVTPSPQTLPLGVVLSADPDKVAAWPE